MPCARTNPRDFSLPLAHPVFGKGQGFMLNPKLTNEGVRMENKEEIKIYVACLASYPFMPNS
jgi:hypothetical protein